MAARHITTLTALTLALALGACGGENTEDPAATTDEVAEAADPAAAEAEAEAAVEETTDTAATEASEAVADSDDALDNGWEAMQENWDSSAGMVKDRWAELTEEEILATDGDREQLVSLVQETYGIEREQAEQEVSDWAATL